MKRKIIGAVVALAGLLGLAGSQSERNPRERVQQTVAGILIVCGGSLAAAAGFLAAQRKKIVGKEASAAVARRQPVDLRGVAEAAGVSPLLAQRYIEELQNSGDLPWQIDVRSPLPGDAVLDVPWRSLAGARDAGHFLETLLSVQHDRPVQLVAFATAARKRGMGHTLLLALALAVLVWPGVIAALVLALPGLLYFTWAFFSRWDENNAYRRPNTGSYIAMCVFPLLAGAACLAALSPNRRYILCRDRNGDTFLLSIPAQMDGLTQAIRADRLRWEPANIEEVSRKKSLVAVRVRIHANAAAPMLMVIDADGRLTPYSALEENLELLLNGRPQGDLTGNDDRLLPVATENAKE